MTRRRVALVLCCLLLGPAGLPAEPLRTEEKGTFLGALFSPVPEAFYDQLPQLPRGQGVLVTHILPDSPAARADLRRHDLLYQYDGTKIRDCEHFVRLIRDDKPGRAVKLVLLRGGQEMTLKATLAEGPVLKVAGTGKPASREKAEPRRKSAAPSVSVAATPLEDGKMKVTIAYYQTDSGRLHTLTCQGATAEIDGEVQKLPERERSLVRAALQRIRELNSTKKN
jgi:C-terminal processing protease CtpA/Prc